MDRGYAVAYRDLFRKHWWWRAREHVILEAIESHRPAGGWTSILDVGCGDGLFFDQLRTLGTVDGIETDPTALTPDGPWRERIHVGPFDRSFEPGRRYSLILMLDVLEHFPDPLFRLQRAGELLAPDGYLIVTVPAFEMLWTMHDDLNRHFARFRRKTLGALLEQAGFRVESSRYFYHWTFPIKLLVRLKEAVFGGEPVPPAVPRRWANRFLYNVSRIEQKTLGRLPVPFGTSVLAVAKRSQGTTSTGTSTAPAATESNHVTPS
jgi:SAM-dependent methyltransferase